jgi:hypothetical protein
VSRLASVAADALRLLLLGLIALTLLLELMAG